MSQLIEDASHPSLPICISSTFFLLPQERTTTQPRGAYSLYLVFFCPMNARHTRPVSLKILRDHAVSINLPPSTTWKLHLRHTYRLRQSAGQITRPLCLPVLDRPHPSGSSPLLNMSLLSPTARRAFLVAPALSEPRFANADPWPIKSTREKSAKIILEPDEPI